MPKPTVLPTVERSKPKVEPAAPCVKACPGWTVFDALAEYAPVVVLKLRFGRALLSVVDGLAKFAELKMLKTSVRNSKFIVSVKRNFFEKVISNCRKLGPDNSLREILPKVPAAGVANAAGLIRLRSLFK